jgi:hypothetical protein
MADQIIGLLSHCILADNQQRGEAERKLHEMISMPGFPSTLLNLSTSLELNLNLRLAAILFLKNIIRSDWNAIHADERQGIRENILVCLRESEAVLSEQYNLCIGFISEHDFPEVWPGVISQLLTCLQGTNPVERSNAIQSLRFVIESLSDEPAVSAVRQIMPFLMKILLFEWRLSVEQLLAESGELAATSASVDMQTKGSFLLTLGRFSLCCFKLFLSMITSQLVSLSEPRHSPDVQSSGAKAGKRPSKGKIFVADQKAIWQWIQQMILYFPQFDTFRRKVPFLQISFEKLMVYAMRTILLVLSREPLGFRHHLVLALTTVTHFLKSDERFSAGSLDFDRFAVKCLVFLHEVIETSEYREDPSVEDTRYGEAVQQFNAFFSPSTVFLLCRMLMGSYMLLSTEDLVTWEQEPEELVLMELNSYEEKVRPTAETLMSSLTRRWPDVCVPAILEALRETVANPDPASHSSILLKDSVYNTIAIAGLELQEHLDFQQLFFSQFSADLENSDPRYKVIRRRIAAVIENWFCLGSIPLPHEMMNIVFNSLLFLLRPEEDTVPRIWAAIALRNVILRDDIDKSAFLSYVPSLFASLIDLVARLSHNFIHIQILEIVSVIVKVIGVEVKHVISPLFTMLSVLWNSPDRDLDLLRSNILRCMRNVLKASGREFQQLDYVIPAIEFSVSVGHERGGRTRGEEEDECDLEECQSDLMEDGLRLWMTLLWSSFPQVPEPLFLLFPKLKEIVDSSLYDLSENVIKILFLYVFSGGEGFLSTFSGDIIAMILSLIQEVHGSVSVETMPILHTVVLFLLQSNHALLEQLLNPLLERLFFDEDVLLRIHFLLLFSRVLVLNEQFFWSYFQKNERSFSQFISLFVQIPSDELLPSEARLLLSAAKRFQRYCENSSYREILPSLNQIGEVWVKIGSGYSDVPFEGMKSSLAQYSSNLSCLLGKPDPLCQDWCV